VFFSALWFLNAQTRETLVLLLVVFISTVDFMEMFTKREPPQKFLALF
jgi:hypothetical protein